MIVAFCTKDSGVVFYFSILYFFFKRLHICCFVLCLVCLFPLSFLFFILPYFSSSIIKDFWGTWERWRGKKKGGGGGAIRDHGIGQLGKMLHGISNLFFFFYLFIVSLVLLGCYPGG